MIAPASRCWIWLCSDHVVGAVRLGIRPVGACTTRYLLRRLPALSVRNDQTFHAACSGHYSSRVSFSNRTSCIVARLMGLLTPGPGVSTGSLERHRVAGTTRI